MKITITALLCILLFGCTSNKSPWIHKQHGHVSADNKIIKEDRKQCNNEIYKQGLEIDGVVYTDIDAIIEKYVQESFSRVHTKGKEPEYFSRWQELQKEVSDCIKNKGWTHNTEN